MKPIHNANISLYIRKFGVAFLFEKLPLIEDYTYKLSFQFLWLEVSILLMLKPRKRWSR
jgi:hypothetical protein